MDEHGTVLKRRKIETKGGWSYSCMWWTLYMEVRFLGLRGLAGVTFQSISQMPCGKGYVIWVSMVQTVWLFGIKISGISDFWCGVNDAIVRSVSICIVRKWNFLCKMSSMFAIFKVPFVVACDYWLIDRWGILCQLAWS